MSYDLLGKEAKAQHRRFHLLRNVVFVSHVRPSPEEQYPLSILSYQSFDQMGDGNPERTNHGQAQLQHLVYRAAKCCLEAERSARRLYQPSVER